MAQLLKKLLIEGGGGVEKAGPEPPAWSYMETIGSIWLQPQTGGYYDSPTGQVNVQVDTPPCQSGGGAYWNRQ